MIFGTGVDITDVRRFKKWVEQPELIDRFFNPLEKSSGKSMRRVLPQKKRFPRRSAREYVILSLRMCI